MVGASLLWVGWMGFTAGLPLRQTAGPSPKSASATALDTLGSVLRSAQPAASTAADSQFGTPAGNRYVGRLR